MALDLTYIRAGARFHATGDSSNADFLTADVDRLANDAYLEIIAEIMAYCGWKGAWELPGGTESINITVGANSFAMSSMMLIRRVEIKYNNSDIHREAGYIDLCNLGDKGVDDYIAEGTHKYTFLNGQIVIFPKGVKKADIEAVASGIKVYHQDDITLLSGATDQPKITQLFVSYIGQRVAYFYHKINRMYAEADRMKSDLKEVKATILAFYRQRTKSNNNMSFRSEGLERGQGYNVGDLSINGK